MNVTRRDFIKGSLVLGGSLSFPFNFTFAAQIKEKRWLPAYGKFENEGKLAQRVEEAYSIFEESRLCPRQCGVNRLKVNAVTARRHQP